MSDLDLTIKDMLTELEEHDAEFYQVIAKGADDKTVWRCVVTRGDSADELADALGLGEEHG